MKRKPKKKEKRKKKNEGDKQLLVVLFYLDANVSNSLRQVRSVEADTTMGDPPWVRLEW